MVYYFTKNLQQDVIGILDSNNNLIVKYEYDSFGNILSIKDANNQLITDTNNIGIINAFRYRGYYYDKEIDLYYLNSRYYNPEWGRFISGDKILKVNNDFVSRNVYCYCSNCPVNRVDVDGNSWIGDVFEGIVDGIRTVGKTVYNGAKAIGRNFIKGTSMISGWFFGLNTASEFLNNSLQDNPKNLFYGNGSDIVEKIVNSKQFQRKVHSYAIENPNAVLNKEKLSITFEENMDLYLGLHRTTFEMTGVLENGKGKISFTLTDEYDFDDSEDGLIGPINHTAYTWQEQGWLNNYKIILDFDYCVNCE